MKVLFICEGNVIRSQMAEAFLRHALPEIDAMSAGTHVPQNREGAKRPFEEFPEVIVAMKEFGIDMSDAVSNRLTQKMLDDADRVILVGPITSGIPEYLRDFPGLEEWGVPDPGYGDVPVTNARDMIRDKIELLVEELKSFYEN